MDSISQFALGASVGHLTLGKRAGRSAMIAGGIVGSLPDADVLAQYSDAIASFTYHRSYSHSLFVLTALSPLLALLLQNLFRTRFAARWTDGTIQFSSWLWFSWLVLITHPLLDAFTIYGTQIFWPLPLKPVAIGSIFIIDPLYTLPLLIGLFIAWRADVGRGLGAVKLALLFSTLYLGVTLLLQFHVKNIAVKSLTSQSLPSEQLLVAPTPLSFLWRIVSLQPQQYQEGYYSFFDADKELTFDAYERGESLINSSIAHWPVSRVKWFTSGMIGAQLHNDRLIINDLRMGIEAQYVFRFDVGRFEGDRFYPEESQLLPLEFDSDRMKNVVMRVTDESTDMRP